MNNKVFPYNEIIKKELNKIMNNVFSDESFNNFYYAIGYKFGINDKRTFEQFKTDLGEHFDKDYTQSYIAGWLDGSEDRQKTQKDIS